MIAARHCNSGRAALALGQSTLPASFRAILRHVRQSRIWEVLLSVPINPPLGVGGYQSFLCPRIEWV